MSDAPTPPSLDLCLLDKTRGEIYTILLDYAERLGIYPTLDITPSEFLDFIIDVDKGYQPNPYHSFYHAADVALVLFHMLERYYVSQYLLPIDVAALFIAGLCHDLGHPGLNNNYQVNLKTELAIRYNNKSVLESYSCTLAMELITKHKLLSRLKRPLSADQVRTSIIKMILATDMVFHYELQENLASLLEILSDRTEDVAEQEEEMEMQVKDIFESKGDKSPLDNFDMQAYVEGASNSTSSSTLGSKTLNSRERQMLCQIVLHAADISNAVRPWPICERWSDLVCEEFFRQGDEERKHGLPLSPNMDRNQVTQSTIGLQFGDFVASPYFEIFAAMFPAAEEMLDLLKANRTEWLQREQQEAKSKSQAAPPDHPTTTIAAAAANGYHGRQPEDMLPDQSILNPSGRRVSVAAGMIIIPDELEERVIGSGKTRCKYLGLRSISDTGIMDAVAHYHHVGRSAQIEALRTGERHYNGRRKSEEPGYFLYRHRLEVPSRRHSRSDIVDKCLEQQCQVASTTPSP